MKIIDVREPHEYDVGHVEGAVNMPMSQFFHAAEHLQDVPKDEQIVLYCNRGNRSGAAMRFMIEQLGYKNVINGIDQKTVESQYVS